MKKAITVVFSITFLVLGFTACGGGDEMDVAMDAMENVFDIMEDDLFPAMEDAERLQRDIGGDIDDDGSESQQKRFEELKNRAETVDKKFRKFGF